jgi:hypothetical protein
MFCLAHANKTVTDEYAKVLEDVQFRREGVEMTSLGFTLPEAEQPTLRKLRNRSEQLKVGAAVCNVRKRKA